MLKTSTLNESQRFVEKRVALNVLKCNLYLIAHFFSGAIKSFPGRLPHFLVNLDDIRAMHIHLFTPQYGYMYGQTHGSGGACMDTHMVVGVRVWTHTVVGVHVWTRTW